MKIVISEEQYKKIIYEQIQLDENRVEYLKDKFVNSDKIEPELFDEIVNADPTTEKKYLQWLLNQYIKVQSSEREKELFFEDLYKMTEYLQLFDRLKNNFINTDINQYKNYRDFFKNAVEVEKTLSGKNISAGVPLDDIIKSLYIGEVAGYKVYKLPKGRTDLLRASRALSADTKWCTKNTDEFKKYISEDSLYIFTNGEDKYQFHSASNQFMDKYDIEVDFEPTENEKLFKQFLLYLIEKDNVKVPTDIKINVGISLTNEEKVRYLIKLFSHIYRTSIHYENSYYTMSWDEIKNFYVLPNDNAGYFYENNRTITKNFHDKFIKYFISEDNEIKELQKKYYNVNSKYFLNSSELVNFNKKANQIRNDTNKKIEKDMFDLFEKYMNPKGI